MDHVVFETNLEGLGPVRRGKVRDCYDLGDTLLLVATDRVSAFDWVLPTPIPDKGRLLTALSVFWFRTFQDVENHLVTDNLSEMPARLAPHRAALEGRAMLVRKLPILQVECVVRGYLAGSGWESYRETGEICGVKVPAGLRRGERFPEPIFTPTTKETRGHDLPITFAEVERRVGGDLACRVREASLSCYARAEAFARERGILLADTKFEWGVADGRLVLADEVLTPDSSRFWPAEDYRPGSEQPSFDKQFVRDFLTRTDWDRNSPPPSLPADVVEKTRERYREACRRLAGRDVLLGSASHA